MLNKVQWASEAKLIEAFWINIFAIKLHFDVLKQFQMKIHSFYFRKNQCEESLFKIIHSNCDSIAPREQKKNVFSDHLIWLHNHLMIFLILLSFGNIVPHATIVIASNSYAMHFNGCFGWHGSLLCRLKVNRIHFTFERPSMGFSLEHRAPHTSTPCVWYFRRFGRVCLSPEIYIRYILVGHYWTI